MEKSVHEPVSESSQEQLRDAGPEVKAETTLSKGSALPTVNDAPKPAPTATQPIPNGGLYAWLQVLGAFCLMMNSWGNVNAYGAYQTYYETQELFTASSSQISWIGALQGFLLLFVGALTGPLYDAGWFHFLIGFGSLAIVFGQMMLSLCHEYWQTLLAQAFCMGIGNGFLYTPSVALLSTYFNTKLPIAVGIASVGSSVGGILYSAILHTLIDKVGFGWAARIIGFIQLATLSVSFATMRQHIRPSRVRKLVDFTALKDAPWMFYTLSTAFVFIGFYVPFFYVQFYAISKGITSPNLGFYLLTVLNGAQIFGRTIPSAIAMKIGPMNTLTPTVLVSGILTLCLIRIESVGGVIVFCVLYGFFSSPLIALPGPILVRLSPNPQLIGTRMGMAFATGALGVLIGTPIAGAIIGTTNFTGGWIFGGVIFVVGSFGFVVARGLASNWKLRYKV